MSRKQATSSANRVAKNSSLVQRKKKRSAAVNTARELTLTPVAKQLIKRELAPHREVKHKSFGITFNVTQCSMAAGADTNVFSIAPFLERGLGDDQLIGNRCRLIRYTVHVHTIQYRDYNPVQTAALQVPNALRMRYMFGQPKEAPNKDTFTGAVKNRFRDFFLEQDDLFRDYNGSLTHWYDKHNPSIFTLHKQFKKRINFEVVHDRAETGVWTNKVAEHKVTWVYKPKNKILQFKPKEAAAMYPENFNPLLVVLPNRVDQPFADYVVTAPPGGMVQLNVVWMLDYEDME